MTKKKLERAIELHKEGLGWNAIGRDLDLHPNTVRWHLLRQGLRANKKGVGRYIEWDVEEAKRMRNDGCSWMCIGDFFGVSGATVARYFKRHDIKL
jgi:orotate phosphoribosyltransferase-like protein